MPQAIEVPNYGIVEFPDDMSDADIVAAIKKNSMGYKEESIKPEPQHSKIMETFSNIPGSAKNFVSGIAQTVMHPIDTASSLMDVAAGGLRNITPQPIVNAIDKIAPSPEVNARIENSANQVGQFYKDRYGGLENIKNTVVTDPIGALADISTVLYGGSGLARLIPKGAGVADSLSQASRVTNPVSIAMQWAKPTANLAGRGIADLVGSLGTHTGGESLKTAFNAAREGGKSSKSMFDNMRGKVPITDVLDDVKANISEMGAQKSAEYQAGMAKVSSDKSILDFSGIDKSVSEAVNIGKFKGQVTNTKAADAVKEIAEKVAEWKNLSPSEFHTPEGLDALKRSIGGIVEGIPFEEKTARLAANKVYAAVKSEIVKQAPLYAETMKGYSEAADLIKEIERALSIGKKSAADTSMRKLQSLMRNNANTNYGNRLDLAKTLEAEGGRQVLPAIAGQALNTWTPRGLGNVVAGGLGMGGYALGGAPLAAGTLAIQSPRLMGETFAKLGQGARLFDMLPSIPPEAGLLSYQAGRMQP